MARSKIKGTKGKPVKKTKNRDKLRASIHVDADRGRVVWKNDNKPHRTWTSGGRSTTELLDKPNVRNPNAAWGVGGSKKGDGYTTSRPISDGNRRRARSKTR